MTSGDRMRQYWDEGARENAMWFVDTSIDFDEPDADRFFASGTRIVEQALAHAEPISRELAVEIGSGLGRLCGPLAERFDRVVGIDVSSEMIARAEALTTDPSITYRLGDGRHLVDVDDGSADLVVSFTVFQHIPSAAVIRSYLDECRRVLRPGGVLAFQWNAGSGRFTWAARREVLSVLQRTGLRPETHRRHAPEFLGSAVPVRTMTRWLATRGFEVERVEGGRTLYAWAWARRR